MPPAPKEVTRIDATDAAEEITGDGNVRTMPNKGTKSKRKTAIEDFKDKYIPSSIRSETPNPSPGIDQPNLVVGSLKRHIQFWESIGANSFILSTIRDGYKIPFYETPHSAYFKNNKSATTHSDFVSAEINELLKTGRIRQLSTPPTVVNPLSVDEKDGKCRLILDLRYVNLHVWTQYMKYEDFRSFRSFLKKDSFMFSFDLKSGYHHIEIFEEHTQYLGFSWTEKGITRFYVFLVLPFGLTSAGYIFTKVVRVPVRYWRSFGIKIVVYLDDGIGAVEGRDRCAEVAQFVKSSLEKFGFICNVKKSIWLPTQSMSWLGLVINTEDYTLKISQKRIEKVFSKIGCINSCPKASARQISSIRGSIDSQSIVLGAVTSLFSRNMNRFIASATSWDRKMCVPLGVREELLFWRRNLSSLNSKSLDTAQHAPVSLKSLVNSDASDYASGAIAKIHNTTYSAHKNLSVEESCLSSTWRELDAIRFSITSLAPHLQNHVAVWATDNNPAVSIVHNGSKRPHLHTIAVDIYQVCKAHQIDLHTVWVPREFNEEADALSKTLDYDDWMTSVAFFNHVNDLWEPFTIDRFASCKNTKTPRFNSKYWTPQCEAVDAFTQDWENEENWLVPPVSLVPRVIRHAERCFAKGALIVPVWKSAPYWPMLCANDRQFQPWVLETKVFNRTEGILILGDYKGSLLGSSKFKSAIIAVRFNFKHTTQHSNPPPRL